MKIKKPKIIALLGTVFIAMCGVLVWLHDAEAVRLLNRTLTIGSSMPSIATTHDFSFGFPSASNVGSIQFEYCSNSPLIEVPCIAPAGTDVTGAILAAQTGEIGFVIDTANTTANKLIITRTPAVTGLVTAQYNFSNIMNPSDTNQSVYVRISTYDSTDATGPFIDEGGLVFSTSGRIAVSAYVPPYLRFCTGVTVSLDCSTASGDHLDLGNLTPNATRAVQSQMNAFTNDDTGFAVAVLGTTLTSGNNVINPLPSPTVSAPGLSQFGINLRANTQPSIGQDPQGVGTGGPAPGYGASNLFKYVNGEVVASSPLPTEPNILTISYIANIPKSQPVGIYVTTITFVATAQF